MLYIIATMEKSERYYELLSSAKNVGKNNGKNISQNLSGKYSQKFLDHAKQLAADTLKTDSKKKKKKKTAEAIGDFTGYKIP